MDSNVRKGRRPEVVAAAIEVIGTRGARALTHRSVDAAANVPPGTTSNHFRTRDALLLGAIVETEKLRRAYWRALLEETNPRTVEELVDIITGLVQVLVGELSIRTRAYMVLLREAWSHPSLREPLRQGREMQIPRTLQLMRAVNAHTPELHAVILQDYLAGLIYQQLANPEEQFHPRPAIAALTTLLVGQPLRFHLSRPT